MIGFVRRTPSLSGAIAVVPSASSLLGSFPIVPETKQAVVVRFGKPVRILNRYQAGRPIGAAGAGICWRIPVRRGTGVDRQARPRRRHGAASRCCRPTSDGCRSTPIARYRIVDPLLMYIRARDEKQLAEQLRPILGSEVRNELGNRPFAALLTPERQGDHGQCSQLAEPHRTPVWRRRSSTFASRRPTCPTARRFSPPSIACEPHAQQEARSIRAQGA